MADSSQTHYMPNRHFQKGQLIFQEGDMPDGVYFICEGQVEISRNNNGKEVPLAKVMKDSVFGEMAIIDGKPRSANARATEDTWCYVITSRNFEHKLEQLDPFVRGLFRVFTVNIRNMNDKLQKEIES